MFQVIRAQFWHTAALLGLLISMATTATAAHFAVEIVDYAEVIWRGAPPTSVGMTDVTARVTGPGADTASVYWEAERGSLLTEEDENDPFNDEKHARHATWMVYEFDGPEGETFLAPGEYDVTVTATSEAGETAQHTVTITVVESAGNLPGAELPPVDLALARGFIDDSNGSEWVYLVDASGVIENRMRVRVARSSNGTVKETNEHYMYTSGVAEMEQALETSLSFNADYIYEHGSLQEVYHRGNLLLTSTTTIEGTRAHDRFISHVGQTWSNTYTQTEVSTTAGQRSTETHHVNETWTVTEFRLDPITTPAGHFADAVKIVVQADVSVDGFGMILINSWWVVDGVGFVRKIMNVGMGDIDGVLIEQR